MYVTKRICIRIAKKTSHTIRGNSKTAPHSNKETGVLVKGDWLLLAAML